MNSPDPVSRAEDDDEPTAEAGPKPPEGSSASVGSAPAETSAAPERSAPTEASAAPAEASASAESLSPAEDSATGESLSPAEDSANPEGTAEPGEAASQSSSAVSESTIAPGRRRAVRVGLAVPVLTWSWAAAAALFCGIVFFLRQGSKFGTLGAAEHAAVLVALLIPTLVVGASAVSSLAGGRLTRFLAAVGVVAGAVVTAVFPSLVKEGEAPTLHASTVLWAGVLIFIPLTLWALLLWLPFGLRLSSRGGLAPVPRRIWLWPALLLTSAVQAVGGAFLLIACVILALRTEQNLIQAGRALLGSSTLFSAVIVAWLGASLAFVTGIGHARKSAWARRLQGLGGPGMALLLLACIGLASGADGWGVLAAPGHEPMAAWALIAASSSVLLLMGASYGQLSGPLLALGLCLAGVSLAWSLPAPHPYGARPRAAESQPAPVTPLVASRPPDACERASQLEARVPALLEQGKLDRARRVLDRADALCDEGRELRRARRFEVMLELGSIARAIELAGPNTTPTDEALRAREQSCAQDRSADVAQADQALQAGKHEEALRGYEKLFNGCLRDPEALVRAAAAARALGREADAQRWSDRALSAAEQRHAAIARPALSKPFAPSASIHWSDSDALIVLDDEVRVFEPSTLRERALLDARPAPGITAAPVRSDDGRFVAAVSGRHLRVMDVRSSMLSPVFELADDSRLRLAISREGERIATLGGGWLDVWEVAKRTRLAHWKIDQAGIGEALAFVPGSALVVAAAGSPMLADVTRPDESVSPTRFGPGERSAIAPGNAWFASNDGASVVVGPLRPGSPPTELVSSELDPSLLALSSDGLRVVLASGKDERAHVWEVGGRRLAAKIAAPGKVLSLAMTRDGALVAIGVEGGPAGLWKTSNGEQAVKLDPPAENVSSVAFSPDGKRLATLDRSGTAKVFTTSDGRLATERVPMFPERAVAFAAARDGSVLVQGGSNGKLYSWDVPTSAVSALPSVSGTVFATSLSSDARNLIVASDAEVVFFDAGIRSRAARPGSEHLGVSPDRARYALQQPGGAVVRSVGDDTHLTWVRAPGPEACGDVVFSSDGAMIAAAGGDGRVRIRRGKPIPLVRGIEQLPWDLGCPALAFSPDDRLLAVGGRESVLVWDLQRSLALWEAPVPQPIRKMAFSPDGSLIVTTSKSDGVRVWETASGRQHTQLWPDDDARVAQFLPGTRRIAWTGELGGIRIGDADRGSPVGTLLVLLDGKIGLSIASDGTMLIVGDASAVEGRLSCAIGAARLPFEACAERLVRPSLLRELLTGDDSWLEP